MAKIVQFIGGMLLLVGLEFLKASPGSVTADGASLGNYLAQNIFWFRVIGWLIVIFPALTFILGRNTMLKIFVGTSFLCYAFVLYWLNK